MGLNEALKDEEVRQSVGILADFDKKFGIGEVIGDTIKNLKILKSFKETAGVMSKDLTSALVFNCGVGNSHIHLPVKQLKDAIAILGDEGILAVPLEPDHPALVFDSDKRIGIIIAPRTHDDDEKPKVKKEEPKVVAKSQG